MRKVTIIAIFIALFMMNCAFKEQVKRDSVGGTSMVVYEATEVSLFKDVKTIKPTCLNGIKKTGVSRVVGVSGENSWAYNPKIFSSSSQASMQNSVNSTRASSTSSTVPVYSLACQAIGVN